MFAVMLFDDRHAQIKASGAPVMMMLVVISWKVANH